MTLREQQRWPALLGRSRAAQVLDGQLQQANAMARSATNVVPIRESRVIEETDEQALTAIAAHLQAGGIVVFVP